MSSEKTHAMKFDDILRYFAEKGVRLTCPSCGQDAYWELGYVPDSNDPNTVIGVNSLALALPDIPKDPHNSLLGPSTLLITSTCSNCSYVRCYDYLRIKAWTDENPADGAKE